MIIRNDIFIVLSGYMGFNMSDEADCNVYAVKTEEGLVLIDTGAGIDLNYIEVSLIRYGFQLIDITYILLTHLHADHSGGAAKLKDITNCKLVLLDVAVHSYEQAIEEDIELSRAREAGIYPFSYKWITNKVDIILQDNDSISIGSYNFQVLYTPGHSQFDTCYYMRSNGKDDVLFSGDTIFAQGKISMLASYDFSVSRLYASLQKLAPYPTQLLCPGHGAIVYRNGQSHIQKALLTMSQLKIPDNII